MSLPLRWEDAPPTDPVIVPPKLPLRRRTFSVRRIFATTFLLILAMSISALTILGAQRVWDNVRGSSSLRLEAQIRGQELSMGLPVVERRLGYITVTGSIASHVTRPLSQVEAVVELLGPQNETMQVESAMVAFDPLMPGQSSPFRIELPDNTHAVGYRIRFKQLSGAILN